MVIMRFTTLHDFTNFMGSIMAMRSLCISNLITSLQILNNTVHARLLSPKFNFILPFLPSKILGKVLLPQSPAENANPCQPRIPSLENDNVYQWYLLRSLHPRYVALALQQSFKAAHHLLHPYDHQVLSLPLQSRHLFVSQRITNTPQKRQNSIPVAQLQMFGISAVLKTLQRNLANGQLLMKIQY